MTKNPLIEKHHDKGQVFYTTPLFWDCDCEMDYIHPASEPQCYVCQAWRDEQPNARVNEVLRYRPASETAVGRILEELAVEMGILDPIPF